MPEGDLAYVMSFVRIARIVLKSVTPHTEGYTSFTLHSGLDDRNHTEVYGKEDIALRHPR